MKKFMIIFNGINLPYHVIDYAINKAKENTAALSALFLQGKHEPSKGYGFPGDLGSTETWASDAEAVKQDEEIILDNMRLVKKMMDDENILYRAALKTN